MTHTKLNQIKMYLLSELRSNIRAQKTNIHNRDFMDGQVSIIRNTLEDFFMTRDEVGIVINETWEAA